VVIRQGDLYWVDLGQPSGAGPGLLHPCVVVQNDVFNASEIKTTVVCKLTSKLRRADAPGNVGLDEGEAGLPRKSVVNVSQIFTIDKSELTEKIGSLSELRVREVVRGIQRLTEPRAVD
jgi:mRNA interferase MazF